MHRSHIITQRVDDIRAEAIRHAGIGIVVLEIHDSALTIANVNDAFSSLTGYAPEELQGAPLRVLRGPRTDVHRLSAMETALRANKPWKDTIVLQNAHDAPLPVTVDIVPRTWPEIDGLFAIATIMDASPLVRARNIQRLSNDISVIIGRAEQTERQALRLATAMVRDFADWCAIHLRMPDGNIALVAMTSRTGQGILGDQETNIEHWGIGKVIASGIPLLHQPSHRENLPLSRQMQNIIGRPVHAVTSVPIAARAIESFGAITWAITDDNREYHHEDVQAAEEAGSKFGHYLEENQIRDSLARAVKAREGFMKAAGHELRTPLVSIKGYTQLLLRDFRRETISSQRLEAGLKAIDISTSRLTDLMEDLFAVSTPGSTSLPLRLATVDINEYIQEFLTTTPSLSLAGHNFHLKSTDEQLMTSIDLTRFSQVLFNVVINAVHFSPPDSDVYITTTRETTSVLISVQDKGKGLDPGEEITIFDPFTHARSWQQSEDQGLGIGLYISKQIVQRHKGEIWAESEGQDAGATIHIRLPLAPEAIIPPM